MTEGNKLDIGKPRLDLIPKEVFLSLGEVLGFGASKYDAHNWRRGIKFSRIQAACLRHLTAWASGEDTDPESGLSHIDHALANLGFLATFIREGRTELDDRYKRE